MHLPIHAEEAPIRIDDGRRVAIDAGGLALEERDDEDDRELLGQRLHRIGCRPRNGLREIEPLARLDLAEIRRVEELFQADDLGTAPRGVTDQALGPRNVASGIGVGVILDEPDRKRSGIEVSHTPDYASLLSARGAPPPLALARRLRAALGPQALPNHRLALTSTPVRHDQAWPQALPFRSRSRGDAAD